MEEIRYTITAQDGTVLRETATRPYVAAYVSRDRDGNIVKGASHSFTTNPVSWLFGNIQEGNNWRGDWHRSTYEKVIATPKMVKSSNAAPAPKAMAVRAARAMTEDTLCYITISWSRRPSGMVFGDVPYKDAKERAERTIEQLAATNQHAYFWVEMADYSYTIKGPRGYREHVKYTPSKEVWTSMTSTK